MTYLLILGALFLAFSNGANDNFKGFATVWGSWSLSYRQALILATIATVSGSLVSLLLAESLVQQFSGKGLVPDAVAIAPAFIVAVGLGAAITVMVATRSGLPISTTHALIGGLVGAGLADGGSLSLSNLADGFLLPLLVSPLIAALLGLLVYFVLRLRPSDADCACVVEAEGLVSLAGSEATMSHALAEPRIVVASEADCAALPALTSRFSISRLLDRVHVLSAASICFARGVNDTPKLTALLVAAQLFDARQSVGLIAAVMALGGVMFARRVAETMSRRINTMDATQGLAANLITAILVLFASKHGVPVSTTHVSVGSIVGVGAGAGTIDWAVARHVLLSWVATLPLAATIAWSVAVILA